MKILVWAYLRLNTARISAVSWPSSCSDRLSALSERLPCKGRDGSDMALGLSSSASVRFEPVGHSVRMNQAGFKSQSFKNRVGEPNSQPPGSQNQHSLAFISLRATSTWQP